MDNQIRVVLADDQRLFREGLCYSLRGEQSINIVGQAISGRQTIEIVDKLKPDVALIDFVILGMNGAEIIPTIKEKSPNTKPLMLSNSEKEDMIFKTLKAGARGYLNKNASTSDLVKAIKAVHKGELWVDRKLFTLFFERENLSKNEHQQPSDRAAGRLTSKEEQVLYYLTKDYTNKEIAHELSISERTVKSHLNNIFKKLAVTSRLKAILYAMNRGLR
jgi:DNA-binding NarL/FixJ family response regulator